MPKTPKKGYAPLTDEERAEVQLFARYVSDYKKLRRSRMRCFEERGMIELTGDIKSEFKDGRNFILGVIKFFEKEDKAYCYNICAELKQVLDEYDKKFRP